eukprot:scaffold8904_cov149-Skeletonema_menzelii.AAC.17
MDDHLRSRSRSRSTGRNNHRSRSKSDSRKKRKEHKYRSKKSRHRRRYESEDESMSSYSSASSRSDNRYSTKKRKRSKHHKRKKDKHKHKRKRRNRDASRSPSRSPSASNADSIATAPPGAHELANSLTKLFTLYPSMASIDDGGIPLLFIQLGRGTEYNLSHMPDRNLAGLLDGVFQSLRVHGMELSNGAWKWGNAPRANNARQNGDDLALLRLTRALLNGVAVNLESVQEYEKAQQQQQQQQKQQNYQQNQIKQAFSTNNNGKEAPIEEDIKQKKRIERMTSQLLDRFDRPSGNDASTTASLAGELQGICDVILEGESVQLDGIENSKLKASLAQLFQLVGLELVEIEDEDEEDEDKSASNPDDTDTAMGYALPDDGIRDDITSKLKEVLRVCRFRSSNGTECAPTSWAASSKNVAENNAAESSDEDDGPAPLGTIAAAKAAKRIRQKNNSHTASAGAEEGGREEWMMVPGEHDFLKGISKSDFRGRKFKNSKSSDPVPAVAPINPEVLAEVQAIHQAYQESRGPSLLDAHRQIKAQQQQQDKKSGEWKWNREKNLDDGRRVDKNALHMVLGGASTELKSKFQSGQS